MPPFVVCFYCGGLLIAISNSRLPGVLFDGPLKFQATRREPCTFERLEEKAVDEVNTAEPVGAELDNGYVIVLVMLYPPAVPTDGGGISVIVIVSTRLLTDWTCCSLTVTGPPRQELPDT